MFTKTKLILLVLVAALAIAVVPTFALQVSVSGYLDGYTNPADEYPIYVEAGEVIGVNLSCIGDSLDPEVNIYDPSGSLIDNDDDGSNKDCAQGDSSRLSFTAHVTGIYIIFASSYEIISDDDPGDINAYGAYTLLISGNFTPLFSYNSDGRINFGHGDLYAVLFKSSDDAGNPAIDVYCDTGATSWTPVLHVTAGSSNMSADTCNVDVYVLEDGSYQFNITTPESKLYTVICNDLACEGREYSYFDPNE